MGPGGNVIQVGCAFNPGGRPAGGKRAGCGIKQNEIVKKQGVNWCPGNEGSGVTQPQASASQLKLAWNDCGDSSTHTKITSFSPSTITTGQTATMAGTGNLDEDVSGATFDLEMNTLAGKVSCKGDASQSKTCHLPLGVGSLTFNAMSFPIKKGSTTVSVDLSLSAMLPGALAHTETKVTATATGGDKLFCMDIKSAPAVNEASMVTATNASILEGVDCSKAACQKDCGCAMDKCAASIQTCLADKTCAKGQDCVMNCACGDKYCAMKCARAHPSRKGMAVAMCLANNCESDMGTAAMDEFVAQPQASASQLKLAWNDCGDSSTHTKITSFSPSTITTGQTATM